LTDASPSMNTEELGQLIGSEDYSGLSSISSEGEGDSEITSEYSSLTTSIWSSQLRPSDI